MSQLYKSYAFTIRPRNGINASIVSDTIRWLKRQEYGFLVQEMKDEAAHLHGQLWIDVPRLKGTVALALEKLQERNDPEWDPASKKVLRRGVKIAYNSDFVEEYLAKEDNILYNNPPEYESSYYPSKEEQAAVQEAHKAADKRLHQLSIMYKQFAEKLNPEMDTEYKIAKFLYNSWYIDKTIPTLQNLRYEQELRRKLHHYIYPSPQGYKEIIPLSQSKKK